MKLTAIFLFFKEAAFLEPAIRAVYPVVDAISAVTQYDRNLAGKPISPDESVQRLLCCDDPQNKIRFSLARSLDHLPGKDNAARLRNLAILNSPPTDYFLIMDSDEIWPTETLRAAWAHVQKEQATAYKCYTNCYFKMWNFRVMEKGDGYRPLVFLRNGFQFEVDRQVNWWSRARWGEYLRLGRKPKTQYLPQEMKMHHGSGVGDDKRILTKLTNYSHSDGVSPDWFQNVWQGFSENSKNFHYFGNEKDLYQGVQLVQTASLPREIKDVVWPPGWINRESPSVG